MFSVALIVGASDAEGPACLALVVRQTLLIAILSVCPLHW